VSILEIFLFTVLAMSIQLLWFWVVMRVAKITVGKDAKISQIMGFLLIAGPVGWIVIVIIFVTDIINRFFNKSS
jgi:TRAP-type C4-dicarboxylate transport system permease small subunit